MNLAKKDQRPPGNIGIIADEIRPAMKEIEGQPGDLLHNAVVANVKLNAARLAKVSPVIRKHIEDGSTRIVGADYDLDTGRVNLIGP